MIIPLFYIILVIFFVITSYYIFYRNYMTSYKIVAFDMDETLGNFFELSGLWNIMKNLNPRLTKQDFFMLLDMHQEYLRPNLQHILNYLKTEKKNKNIHRVIIFTNNQGPKSWSFLIKDYLNYKLQYLLFDHVVGAYKIGNGKQIEKYRTSHDKKYEDLLKCAKINKVSKICFIDDQKHQQMIHENVYYILIDGYEYQIPLQEKQYRFVKSNLYKKFNKVQQQHILKYFKSMSKYATKMTVTENDKQTGKNLLNSIKTFVKKF